MVYATEESVERILAQIEHRKNREALRTFLEEQRSNGVKLSSLVMQANHVRHWAVFLGEKAFTDATKEDVRKFTNLRTTERSWRPAGTEGAVTKRVPISNTTMNIRKTMLKSFQRWVRGGGKRDPYPEEVKWLEQKRSADDEALPVEQILTPDELRLMVEAAPDTQTKALLAVLYDSGARASEFCALRVRDVIFDDYGAILALPKDGTNLKTGARRIRVISATAYLRGWVNAHPVRKAGKDKDGRRTSPVDPGAPLWLAMSRRNGTSDPLRANSLGYIVQTAAKRAGLDKDVYPHLFRHSRATLAAKEGWPESVMRAHFGWARSSDMPTRYIHLAGKDADDFILSAAGVKPQDRANTLVSIAPQRCPDGHLNAVTNDYCEHPGCGRALTPEAAEKTKEAEMEAMISTLSKKPDLLAGFAELLATRTVPLAKGRAANAQRPVEKRRSGR